MAPVSPRLAHNRPASPGVLVPSGAVGRAAPHGVHNVQNGALSLTNVTEAGTVYAPAEVAELAGLARAAGMPVHMDGARFANAVAALGCSPAELSWKAGVDVLSFGGTKNGCLGVAAVVLFDPGRGREFELRRKRGGHLHSKHRFLSAQMEAYLEGDLWLDLAEASNTLRGQSRLAIAACEQAYGRNCVEVGGVWIDDQFKADTKAVVVKAQSEAYFRILEKQPKMKDVFCLGNHLVWIAPSGQALVIDAGTGQEKLADEEIDKLFAAAPAKK